MTQNTKTLKISSLEAQTLFSELLKKDFKEVSIPNKYVLWRVEGNNLVVMMYTSGSLVIQGKGDTTLVTSRIEGKNKDNFTPHLGSDEVGKGDYFGPLVVCCVYLDEKTYDIVSNTSITDSKKLSDFSIRRIYSEVKEQIDYSYISVSPKEYNEELTKFKNLSYFLANIHRKTASLLLSKLKVKKISPQYIVIDQFSLNKNRLENEFKGLKIEMRQFHKGESDIAVATASVFARAIFLEEMESMNEKYNFTFPKGATDVIDSGVKFVKKYGREKLTDVAKISFKTTAQIFSLF